MSPDEVSGFILGLPIDATNMDSARAVSMQFLRLMGPAFPEIDTLSATLAQQGLENHRADLFCAQYISKNERCMRRPHHGGDHSSRWEA